MFTGVDIWFCCRLVMPRLKGVWVIVIKRKRKEKKKPKTYFKKLGSAT